MRYFPQLLILTVAWCTTTALAAPTACNPFRNLTAKFDKITTYDAVPAGFQSVDWSGFIVYPATDVGIAAKSSPNVALAPGQGAYITQTNGQMYSYTEAFSIVNFFFGCAAHSGISMVAVDCSVQVIAQTDDRDIATRNLGIFDFSAASGALTKVNLDGAAGNWYFNLVAGQGNAMLVFDNILISNFNPSCPIGP